MKGLTGLFARLSGRGNEGRQGCRILPLNHDGPIYAIGDIHGCRTLLRLLIDRIVEDATASGGLPMLVPLGDLVDRGTDAAGVIDAVLSRDSRCVMRPIMGNHERMMMSFLEAPHRHLSWLDMGGYETLRSYGLALSPDEAASMSVRRLSQLVASYVPAEHVAWLASLPHGYRLTVRGRRTLLVHAGFDPLQGDDGQAEDVLLWGRAASKRDGSTGARGESVDRLVHGHLIIGQPDPLAPIVCIDTGAYLTGRLTALRLLPDTDPVLLSVEAPAN